jgi:hypothetical protein
MSLTIDLSAGYTPPLNAIDMSDSPEPVYTGATLDFDASASGWVALSGTVDATLDITVFAAEGIYGPVAAELGFTVHAEGQAGGTIGAVSSTLDIAASADGFNDWSAAGVDKDRAIYLLVLGDTDPITIPISSWQATARQGDVSSYLNAVVPAYEPLADAIAARQGERMEIRMGFRFDDGAIRSEPIISGPMQTLTAQSGPRNSTATMSGYARLENTATGADRTLVNIRTTSETNGKLRVRADVDLFLRPGMTAHARGRTFTVNYINYYATQSDRFCEAGE